jgi:hypothetical protein
MAPEGAANVIDAETEMYKEVIDIKAHLITVMSPLIIALLKIATPILKILDGILYVIINIEYFIVLIYDKFLRLLEKIWLVGNLATPFREAADAILKSLNDEPDPNSPRTKFQQEVEDFLGGRGANQPGKSISHPKRNHPGRRHKRPKKPAAGP